LVDELSTSHIYEKEWVLYQNYLVSEAWEEKYPSRGFWTDPRIGGFDPRNLTEEGKRQGKMESREEGRQLVESGSHFLSREDVEE
jgi:hypothetical protein